jgi:CubicO group peptidase (beta-lactamase class C family)
MPTVGLFKIFQQGKCRPLKLIYSTAHSFTNLFMNKHTRFFNATILFVLLFVRIDFLHGQTDKNYSKETARKIAEVEHNLKGWVQIADAPVAWTLADRMKFYHANGVSIAVIKDYKIEWAKGYGWADSTAQQRVQSVNH